MNDGINIKVKNLYFINFNHFSFLIIFLFLISFIENTWENHRKIINLFSQIHIIISGKGNQSLLNNTFYPEPYKVYVNSLKKILVKNFVKWNMK